jgi:chromosome segregation ATPase
MPMTDDELKQIRERRTSWATTIKGLTWDETQAAIDIADEDRDKLLDEVDRLAARVAELESFATLLSREILSRGAEIAALRAELSQTPPTLEWLRQQFGEEQQVDRTRAFDTMVWYCGVEWCPALYSCFACAANYREHLPTRAAVLAAVQKQGYGE